ncbi:uncharacterized protein FTJAE_13966 [Fusarium tjaetaba]|uniref:Uncharacterized protein n=1 Tax=Fusarium tjaetaba TaxID=1567544 RepID=A0A8H5QEL4_9HYPO|nr:uncharacterized protein FTJAE_13966 [Fusarium tjaetaba]KAF5613087.1 hypothetical protein FTJAE_13966 [Fusarium tjaetaba]
MAPSEAKKSDEYSSDIQLDTVTEERGYHSRNREGEIQRPDIVDDICRGLLVQSRIDRIVHGTETKDGEPATLIVFGFRFHGLGKKRRFREATINILFQDADKVEENDPIVATLWPNGDFTLGKPTDIEIEKTRGSEVGGNVGAAYGGANGNRTWQRRKNYNVTDRASLTGSVLLDTDVRDWGPPNTVRLTLHEDETAGSGIVTDLRAAVLLIRQNDNYKFTAKVTIDAKADFNYNFAKGVRDLIGLSPANDLVLFNPGTKEWRRRRGLARYLEDKLAEDVDVQNLNSKSLDELAGVLGTTVLAAEATE